MVVVMVVEMRMWMRWRSCGEGGLVIARGRRMGRMRCSAVVRRV